MRRTSFTLILLGPPGAGKGTQGVRIAANCGIPKISTGEMFRDLAAAGTLLGQRAKTYWSRGEFVPDDLVIELVKARVSAPDCAHGFLLDGFPRTVHQAIILEELLTNCGCRLDGALYLNVEETELIRRLSGRRCCEHCGATYHITSLPAHRSGVCDCCDHALIQRADDTPVSIFARLKEYADKTAPLLAYYASSGLLCRIDANPVPEAVSVNIKAALHGRQGAVDQEARAAAASLSVEETALFFAGLSGGT